MEERKEHQRIAAQRADIARLTAQCSSLQERIRELESQQGEAAAAEEDAREAHWKVCVAFACSTTRTCTRALACTQQYALFRERAVISDSGVDVVRDLDGRGDKEQYGGGESEGWERQEEAWGEVLVLSLML